MPSAVEPRVRSVMHAAATSNVPFAAIASGRNHLAWGELGVWRIAVAVAAYAGMLALHGPLFGAYPLAGL